MPSDDAAPPSAARLLGLTAEIVAAHVSRNLVAADQLPELIHSVHRALGGLGQTTAEPARPEPAVPIRRSVQHDRIICLECRAAFKMIKGHLANAHHLTPEAYRERWDLPRNYPMTAPDYTEVRSGIAKRLGLGRQRGGQVTEDRTASAETEAGPEELATAPDMAEVQDAAANTEPASSAVKGRGRKRDAQPDAPAPVRGRGRRRSKTAGAG